MARRGSAEASRCCSSAQRLVSVTYRHAILQRRGLCFRGRGHGRRESPPQRIDARERSAAAQALREVQSESPGRHRAVVEAGRWVEWFCGWRGGKECKVNLRLSIRLPLPELGMRCFLAAWQLRLRRCKPASRSEKARAHAANQRAPFTERAAQPATPHAGAALCRTS